jgi:hypothetical protein
MATETLEDRSQGEWLYVGAVMPRLGLPRSAVMRLIRAGELTTRQFPGCRLMVSRADVEALAARATQPARPQALACASREA